MNLLLTSIGKRIELIRHLKSSFRVIGVDASAENPAKSFVDAFYRVPRCREEGYVRELLAVCGKEKVSLLVPLYEPEFEILNAVRDKFEKIGVKLVLSEESVTEICNDKRKTAAFFKKYDIPAPETLSDSEVEAVIGGEQAEFPLIVKPADGMGSEGIFFRKKQEGAGVFLRLCGERPGAEMCAGKGVYYRCALRLLWRAGLYCAPDQAGSALRRSD